MRGPGSDVSKGGGGRDQCHTWRELHYRVLDEGMVLLVGVSGRSHVAVGAGARNEAESSGSATARAKIRLGD